MATMAIRFGDFEIHYQVGEKEFNFSVDLENVGEITMLDIDDAKAAIRFLEDFIKYANLIGKAP